MQSVDVLKSLSSLDERKFLFSDTSCSSKVHHHHIGCLGYRNDMKNHSPYDFVLKVILLGDQGVGKTSYMKSLHVHPDVTKVPCKCRCKHTADHIEMEISTVSGKNSLVRLCDTGGQERYRSLTSSYYRGAHGVIVMFDVNHSKSMENVEVWLSDLDSYTSTTSCPKVLLGTNCTSPRRVVSAHDARKYAEHRGMPYMETDSSQFYNIVESIQLVTDRIAMDIQVPSQSSSIIKPSSRSYNHSQHKKKFSCSC